MNRTILITYQFLIGLSDAVTGALLITNPEFTLQLMRLRVAPESLPFLSFIGAFVMSVGLSCLYGAFVMAGRGNRSKLEAVWLLTAMTRASVAVVVIALILTHSLQMGWAMVAISDGACAAFQAAGLRKGWLAHVAR